MSAANKDNTFLQNQINHHEKWNKEAHKHFNSVGDIINDFNRSMETERSISRLVNILEDENEQIKCILDRRPIVIITGRVKCGKSTLMNVLFRNRILPTSPNPCTARICQMSFAERPFMRLLDEEEQEVIGSYREITKFDQIYKSDDIKGANNDQREEKLFVSKKVDIGVNHPLLMSGVRLVDCPGKSENAVISETVDRFYKNENISLVIYVIDGKKGLSIPDQREIGFIQSALPNVQILFVLNKAEHDVESAQYNKGSDDEDEERKDFTDQPETCLKKLQTLRLVLGEDENNCPYDIDNCPSNYAYISSNMAFENYKKKIRRSSVYVDKFELFEEKLIKLLFGNIKRSLNNVYSTLDSYVSQIQACLDTLVVDGKSSPIESLVTKAEEMGTEWYGTLCQSIKDVKLHSRIQECFRIVSAELRQDKQWYKAGQNELINAMKRDRDFTNLLKHVVDRGNSENEFTGKISYYLLVNNEVVCRVFNYLKNTLEIGFTESLSNSSNDLANIFLDIGPVMTSLLGKSYSLDQPMKMVFDYEEIVQSSNFLFDVKPVIIETFKNILRREVESVCRPDIIGDILMKKPSQPGMEWEESFLIQFLDALKIQKISDTVEEFLLEKAKTMHSDFNKSLLTIKRLISDIQSREIRYMVDKKNELVTKINHLKFEKLQMNFQMEQPDALLNNLDEVIYEDSNGSVIRKYRTEHGDCVAKEVSFGDSSFSDSENRVRREKLEETLPWAIDIAPNQNLLRLIGFFKSDDDLKFYIITEKMDGSLASLIQEFSYADRVRMGYQVLEGVHHLFKVRKIYTDIKPDSILVNVSSREVRINISHPQNHLKATPNVPVPFHLSPQLFQIIKSGYSDRPEQYAIFAFGMLLWTLGKGSVCMPDVYAECDTVEEVQKLVLAKLMPETNDIPDDLVNVIELCWQVLDIKPNLKIEKILEELKGVVERL